MLAEEQLKTSNLEEHLQQLRSEIQDATTRIQNLEGSEKTLTDKTKDQASCNYNYTHLFTDLIHTGKTAADCKRIIDFISQGGRKTSSSSSRARGANPKR